MAKRDRQGSGEEGDPMAWSLDGTYFENCSCDTICPCTWSGLTAHATQDRCKAMLAFHIDRGNIEGVDVSGLTFTMVVDSPPVMSDGGWAVGVLVDDSASDAQREKLGAVLSGQLGGPRAMLGPLIGDMRGMDFVPTEYTNSGRRTTTFGSEMSSTWKSTTSGCPTFPAPSLSPMSSTPRTQR